MNICEKESACANTLLQSLQGEQVLTPNEPILGVFNFTALDLSGQSDS